MRIQVARALDDVAGMFVRLTTRMYNRAKETLDAHRDSCILSSEE